MNDERSEDLSARERAAYESLAESAVPPPDCEARIVDELRARDLVRSAAAPRAVPPAPASLPHRILRFVPRVSLAAAALAGAFFLGTQYGGRPDVVEAPGEPAEAYYEIEKGDGGDYFKNVDGEMVASVRREPLGFHPGHGVMVARNEKPPIDQRYDFTYGDFSLDSIDDSPPAGSPRVR